MTKSPTMKELMDIVGLEFWGRKPFKGQCVSCGSDLVSRSDFQDDLSWREYNISSLCQACQDSIFKESQ